jgi:hypothetical protein
MRNFSQDKSIAPHLKDDANETPSQDARKVQERAYQTIHAKLHIAISFLSQASKRSQNLHT